MALTKSFSKKIVYRNEQNADDVFEKEFNYPLAYIQITNQDGNKDKIKLQVTVFNNDKKENVLEIKYYLFIPSVAYGSTNFIQQGYEYLKTLPEYAESVDC